jgi:hypothetical protein
MNKITDSNFYSTARFTEFILNSLFRKEVTWNPDDNIFHDVKRIVGSGGTEYENPRAYIDLAKKYNAEITRLIEDSMEDDESERDALHEKDWNWTETR